MKKRSIAILLIFMLIVNMELVCIKNVSAKENSIQNVHTCDILDSGKDILYYIFYSQNNEYEQQLLDLNFSREQIDNIKRIALSQAKATNDTKLLFKDKTSDIEIGEYNNIILNKSYEVQKELQNMLNENYNVFVSWLSEYWKNLNENRKISKLDIDSSDDCDIEVYATQFYIDDYCVALPDKYLKFANLGWDYTYSNPTYTVDVISYNRGTEVDNVPVNDVGPWNEMDDYWHVNRWEFTDLELSLPEAEAAYFDNYNDGCDEFGRVVSNPAGIDLSPDVARDLGFGEYESGWISIHLNF